MAAAPSQRPPPPPDDGAGEEALLDTRAVRAWVDLIGRSLARHPLLAGAALLAALAASVVALWALPKTYHAEAKVLVQLVGGRSFDNRSPTAGAADLVLKRDNLISMVKQAQAVDAWKLHRAPTQRVLDFFRRLSGQELDEDALENVVAVLEKKLVVWATDATVVMTLDWPDAKTCFRLVDAAQKNFIEARHTLEVSSTSEAIAILESHAAEARSQLDGATEELRRVSAAPPSPRRLPRAPAPRRAAEPDHSELDQKQAALRAADDSVQSQSRALAEQQAQLAAMRAELGPMHPRLAEARLRIAGLQDQLAQLTERQKGLRDELAALRSARPSPAVASPIPQEGADASAPAASADPQDLEGARNRLRAATARYEELRRRIDSTQIELDTAEANFARRYSVFQPAQMPRRPRSPQPVLVLGAGAASGIFLALLLCVAVEQRRARRSESPPEVAGGGGGAR